MMMSNGKLKCTPKDILAIVVFLSLIYVINWQGQRWNIDQEAFTTRMVKPHYSMAQIGPEKPVTLSKASPEHSSEEQDLEDDTYRTHRQMKSLWYRTYQSHARETTVKTWKRLMQSCHTHSFPPSPSPPPSPTK